MKHRVSCWMLLACLVGWTVPLHAFERSAVEKSVVRVINETHKFDEAGNRISGSGSGTVINDSGDILTNYHVIEDSRSLSVESEFSGGELRAQIVWESEEKDLAIIRASGLRLSSAPFFTGELKEGSDVFAMGYPGAAGEIRQASQANGKISHFLNGTDIDQDWRVRAIQHGATVTGGNSGGPLFDDCGRVIGVNTARPHVMTAGGRVPDNAQINWASHINESVNVLRAKRIAFTEDATPCVSAAGGADPVAARAAEEATERASAAESKAESAQQGARQAQQQADQATQAVEEVVQASRLTNTLVGLVAVVTLVALGLALRKPRREIIRVAGQMADHIAQPLSRLAQSVRRKKSAIALTGFDAQGRPVTLRLSRTDLNQKQGGFTVGRHPLLVDHVLNGDQLSKRHARFSGSDGSVFVEDLNSSNGTSVNGTACPPFQPVQIQPGDMVDVGDIALRVSS